MLENMCWSFTERGLIIINRGVKQLAVLLASVCLSRTSWDEHLFEIVLPKSCSVGHIDFKFSLHPFCLNAPFIEVTLLKQNLNSIGRVMFDKTTRGEGVKGEDLDTGQDPGPPSASPPAGAEAAASKPASSSATLSPSSSTSSSGNVIKNTVLDPQFLKHYGAEILCGPVDMRCHLDLSGHSGLVTLTSPQLLKTKSRSFLVHIKAMCASPTVTTAASTVLSDKVGTLLQVFEIYTKYL